MGDISQAEYYLKLAYQIGIHLDDISHLAFALLNLGGLEFTKRNFSSAFNYINQAIEIAGKTGDFGLKAEFIYNLATAYDVMKDFANAFKIFKDALDLYELLGAKREMGHCYVYLGAESGSLDDADKALKYYKKALKIFIELKDFEMQAKLNHHTAGVYFQLKHNYSSAVSYEQKACDIAEKYRLKTLKKYSRFLIIAKRARLGLS